MISPDPPAAVPTVSPTAEADEPATPPGCDVIPSPGCTVIVKPSHQTPLTGHQTPIK